MKKKVLLKLPGDEEPAIVSYQGRSSQAVIIGVDTDMGRALSRSLSAVGFQVIGLGEADEMPGVALAEYRKSDYSSFGVPDECNLVLYCHDALGDSARHVGILEALCRELAMSHTDENQVNVCVFTPASACAAAHCIREDTALLPHSLREMVCVQAEMTLHAWCFKSHTAILPQIIRHGELYGIEGGHVASCLRRAASGQDLLIPGLGNQRRTLTHIEDFADAAATLLKGDFPTSPINIPGENMDVIGYVSPIADCYGLELFMSRDCFSEELPWGVGDCALSASLFKSEFPAFRLRHSFQKWLSANYKLAVR